MANRNEIMNRIGEYKNVGQDIIRRQYLTELNEYTGNDTIVYAAAFPCHIPGVSSNLLSIGLNDIQGFMTCINGLKSDKLDLIIHSPGGSLEAAEQLVQYLRAKYKYIRAIVPQNAVSASTIIQSLPTLKEQRVKLQPIKMLQKFGFQNFWNFLMVSLICAIRQSCCQNQKLQSG